jgi:hypothetical protein
MPVSHTMTSPKVFGKDSDVSSFAPPYCFSVLSSSAGDGQLGAVSYRCRHRVRLDFGLQLQEQSIIR